MRRSRLATIALFFLSGLALAVWVVSIPAIEQRVGITHAVLGGLILLLGFGSFLGMTLAGPFVDRFGSRVAALFSAVIVVVAVNLPGLASGPAFLGAALFVLGFGSGAIDVAMNDQAVLVERSYGRPIMSSFHAYFSVGGGAGALLGAGTQALGGPVTLTLGIGAAVALVLIALSYPALVSPNAASGNGSPDTNPGPPLASAPAVDRRATIMILACLAFVIMLSEGTANDWSALQAVDHLHEPESAASLAYGTFAVAMTCGRFATDVVVHRFGPVKVVRLGSVLAALGMLAVVLSPAFPFTLVGWAGAGLGLSGIVPQIFSAAGNLGGANQGVVISRIVGAGYLGLLAGPAIIGWVSQGVGLTLALILPIICCVGGVLLAGRVAVASTSRPTASPSGASSSGAQVRVE